jgi:hypothetical protein
MRFVLLLILGAVAGPCQAATWYCHPSWGRDHNVEKCPVSWREASANFDQRPQAAESQASGDDSAAFRRGQADRVSWEAWVGAQSGDTRDGIDYWASHRSLPVLGSCSGGASPATSPEWTSGCEAARQKLAIVDVLRKSQPDYRRGWNNPPNAAVDSLGTSKSVASAAVSNATAPSTLSVRNRVLSWNAESDGDPKSFTFDSLTVTLSTHKEDDEAVPLLHVKLATGEEFETAGVSGFETATSDFIVGRFDLAAGPDQIIFATYTGGAHCCTIIKVIEFLTGAWKTLDVGSFEGEMGDAPKDVDGDGVLDIVKTDDRFGYAFTSFAESILPPKVFNIVNGAVVDVSGSPRFSRLYKADMRAAQAGCVDHNNGACAAFVADASRLGRHDWAWRFMLANYDSKSDWVLPTKCLVPIKEQSCPPDQKQKFSTFPDALRWFLYDTGYTASDDADGQAVTPARP